MTTSTTAADDRLLRLLAQGAVAYHYEPPMRGSKVRLVRSTISEAQKKHLHRLALAGYVAEAVTGDIHTDPPSTTYTFTLTALGRSAIGLHKRLTRPVNFSVSLTDAELAKEGLE